jgi:hypothetical protein
MLLRIPLLHHAVGHDPATLPCHLRNAPGNPVPGLAIVGGYVEGTLFPWTMSDFSLLDAIECGIVKLPRVPVANKRYGYWLLQSQPSVIWSCHR